MTDFLLQVMSQGTEMDLKFNCNVMNANFKVTAHGYSYLKQDSQQ